MTITLSHTAYWDLFQETVDPDLAPLAEPPDPLDVIWRYPSHLGEGTLREISLRDGIDLAIAQYQLHQPVTLILPERQHPLEYTIDLSEGVERGQYCLCGSGLAPAEKTRLKAINSVMEINVHINPTAFLTLWDGSGSSDARFTHLLASDSHPYTIQTGQTTAAMQIAAQQIIQCPFQGIVRRIYLESKVWELMGLLLEQETEQSNTRAIAPRLKPDDVDRIYHARDILLQRLDCPPSLLELARQVGLNDCTLKRGFREVFGKTAFGYLHDYRLEKARHLLEDGRFNVSETARKIGFANRSYFASAFKKKFGMNPKDYLNHRNSA